MMIARPEVAEVYRLFRDTDAPEGGTVYAGTMVKVVAWDPQSDHATVKPVGNYLGPALRVPRHDLV